MDVYNLLALFVFESFTEEVAFHFNRFLHWPLTLSKVTQVRVGELPLLLPQVTIAQSYACGNVISDYLQSKHTPQHCCMWFEKSVIIQNELYIVKDICAVMHSRSHTLTKALEDNVKERDDRSIHEAVQLINKSLFDHLVSWDKHHPLAASPQAEHWTVLLGKLHSKTDYEMFLQGFCLLLRHELHMW